jgi:methionyl-tRNA formyltransferase
VKLVFMGTPAFAAPSLECMVAAGHQVAAVFTQPDRPKGRGHKESMSPVKQAALGMGLMVHQPERIRAPEVVAHLRALNADAMVVVGYGQIIPKAILELPQQGIINVHASMLPKYRGAAPIQWAIARGETRTGVTTMRINEGLDTGDILLQSETTIGPEENAVELSRRLALAGAELLVRTLAELPAIRPRAQDETQASYAPILTKENGKIEWGLSAQEILNRMRGFDPWPGAYGFLRGHRLHICSAALAEPVLRPGVLWVRDRKLFAGCGSGESIELREVQLEGKKRMPAAAFLNGFPIGSDEVLA